MPTEPNLELSALDKDFISKIYPKSNSPNQPDPDAPNASPKPNARPGEPLLPVSSPKPENPPGDYSPKKQKLDHAVLFKEFLKSKFRGLFDLSSVSYSKQKFKLKVSSKQKIPQ